VSAVIRACAILARSFDSGSGNAGLGIPHQDALEASVAARTEHDAMMAAVQSAEQRELAALSELDECRAELKEAKSLHENALTNCMHVRDERDTARAEADQYYSAGLRQGEELDALQTKVARAVKLLEIAQRMSPGVYERIVAALEALR
jgi:hypothetical protein